MVFYRIDPEDPRVRLIPVHPTASLVSTFASVGYLLTGNPAWGITSAMARVGALALTKKPRERALLIPTDALRGT